MIYAIYDADGFVTSVIRCQDDFDIAAHVLSVSGAGYISGSASPDGDRVVDGELVRAPQQPSPFHVFDKQSFSWVLNIDLAKQQARAKINAARDAEELAGFTAYGKTFDSDKTSQQRIMIAANTAQVVGSSFTIDWTCADNSVITLDYAQMLGLPVIMAQAGNALHQKARTLKAQIDAATTLEEINAVVW